MLSITPTAKGVLSKLINHTDSTVRDRRTKRGEGAKQFYVKKQVFRERLHGTQTGQNEKNVYKSQVHKQILQILTLQQLTVPVPVKLTAQYGTSILNNKKQHPSTWDTELIHVHATIFMYPWNLQDLFVFVALGRTELLEIC